VAKKRNKEMKGLRFNKGKLEWSLMPWDALACLPRVIMYGAKKYAPRNWEYGMEYSIVYDCAVRHLTAWWLRDPYDKESRLSHLWHSAINILFLITYELRGFTNYDDRPRPIYGSQKKKKKA